MRGWPPVGGVWRSKPQVLSQATSLGLTSLPVGKESLALAGPQDGPPQDIRVGGRGVMRGTHRWFYVESCPFRYKPHLHPLPATQAAKPSGLCCPRT